MTDLCSIESELFGHIEGAFTGAKADREGKFQQADGGTLFLDEVADMSPKAQAKTLRALEQKQVQPVGLSEHIDVDARLIAATNRDLEAAIEAGNFGTTPTFVSTYSGFRCRRSGHSTTTSRTSRSTSCERLVRRTTWSDDASAQGPSGS